jgi:hypothetical protein
MSIGVLLHGFIGGMINFGDVILYTLFPSFYDHSSMYIVGSERELHVALTGSDLARVGSAGGKVMHW